MGGRGQRPKLPLLESVLDDNKYHFLKLEVSGSFHFYD
jgi:hypothetical protein